MPARLVTWIKKQPVTALYLFAFLFTWLGWAPQALHSRGLLPFVSPIFYILGGVGPLLAVFLVTSALRGEGEFGEPFRAFTIWRVQPIWFVVAILGYPLLWLAALAVSGQTAAELAKITSPLAVVSTFAVSFLAAIPEEVAWRGFALPRLQARFSALTAAFIVGLLWGLWHIPLLLNTDNVMSGYASIPFFITVLARSVIYVWLYNHTRGSLLFVTLFHAVSNSLGTFAGWAEMLVTVAAAALLVLAFGAANLARQAQRGKVVDAPVIIGE